MTVEVETPYGSRRGASVMHVEWDSGIPGIGGDASGAKFRLSGEAVVVELSHASYVFALLGGMDHKLFDVLRRRDKAILTMKEAETPILGLKEPLILSPEEYPLLVTFDDIRDPASVKRVDPANMEASFGPGYRLKSVTMSVTDEPVTEGKVETVLGWLSDYPEPKLSPATGLTTSIPFSRHVSHGDFIRK